MGKREKAGEKEREKEGEKEREKEGARGGWESVCFYTRATEEIDRIFAIIAALGLFLLLSDP